LLFSVELLTKTLAEIVVENTATLIDTCGFIGCSREDLEQTISLYPTKFLTIFDVLEEMNFPRFLVPRFAHVGPRYEELQRYFISVGKKAKIVPVNPDEAKFPYTDARLAATVFSLADQGNCVAFISNDKRLNRLIAKTFLDIQEERLHILSPDIGRITPYKSTPRKGDRKLFKEYKYRESAGL